MGIISRYDFYDFFRHILKTLLEKKEKGFDQRTFEQFVFSMVFEIPCPSAGKLGSTRFDRWRLTLPEITDLPYVNLSHFDKLLQCMEPIDIVRTFTSLLLEERVLLIMDNKEDLLPVSYALQSLIYPFELTIFIPYLANDGYDDDVSNFNHVT